MSYQSVNVWDIVSVIVAVLAFVLSAVNTIWLFRVRMVRYTVKLADIGAEPIYTSEKAMQKLRVTVEFANNSHLTLSITDFALFADGEEYHETKYPFMVFRLSQLYHQKETVQSVYNDHLPIQLDPLGSRQCNFVYIIPSSIPINPETLLNFQIRTNRNTKHKLSLSVGKRVYYKRMTLV